QPGAPAGQAAAPAPGATQAPAAAPATPEEKANQDRAAEILTQAERTARGIRSMEADFSQTLVVPLLNTTQRSTGKLYQRKPDRFLMRFSDPEGDVIVADGRHFWLYYPSSDRTQVIRTSIAEGGEAVDLQQQFLSNPNQRFVATLVGEENVGGQASHVLTLVPRGASPYKILKVWIDKDDYLVRRMEMTEENNSVRTVEMRNIRTNHTLPDNLFTFMPPEGAQIFDQ
ncbi:MAG TPA: outer membrane lipoprotein carrier protein LolA, partial [Longimicrobium sp.]|nr:outer membrane lipoprotein carrier protein LolA [Longimicrobium sp.]